MTENEPFLPPDCDPVIGPCGFKINPKKPGLLGCGAGNGSCTEPKLLQAHKSDFHTAELIKATKEINKILASIPEKENCKLSFIHPKQGTMLAWVEHGEEPIEDAITVDDDPKLVAKHLKLI